MKRQGQRGILFGTFQTQVKVIRVNQTFPREGNTQREEVNPEGKWVFKI